MRIGIDCDGVLRDMIPCLIDSIKETHPEHSEKIGNPEAWGWESWLPFWTEEETEKYVFEDYFLDIFGPECPAIPEAIEDWPKLKQWAKENGHELVLVSAQREHCVEPTDAWLEEHGFDFMEKWYTKEKWSVDVDVLIDDSPEKLDIFKDRSIAYGTPICYKQTWNQDSQKKYMTINKLSDIIGRVFGE